MEVLICEYGVFYTHNKNNAPDYYIGYQYDRYYNDKFAGRITVYCKNADDFIKLIRKWNGHPDWKYILN